MEEKLPEVGESPPMIKAQKKNVDENNARESKRLSFHGKFLFSVNISTERKFSGEKSEMNVAEQ